MIYFIITALILIYLIIKKEIKINKLRDQENKRFIKLTGKPIKDSERNEIMEKIWKN